MQKELALWQFIEKKLKSDEQVILLVVAESHESSPGRQGFKMAVCSDGSFLGSIGGGIMEVKMVELAKAQLQQQTVTLAIKKQIHNKQAPQNQSGMICSGEQTVLFVPLTKDAHYTTVKAIHQSVKKYQPIRLHIAYSPDNQYSIETTYPNSQSPSIFEQSEAGAFRYEEHLGHKDFLYIIGGGHCALALSELMAKLDFHVTVMDDRPNLDTLLSNKYAHHIIHLVNFSGLDAHIVHHPNTYIVIMTVGYRTDEIALRQLLLVPLVKYIGMLGSKNKIATLLQQLQADGFPEEQLKGLHAPIGLPIHSKTPEEIAVSIAAEIIQRKRAPQQG